MTERTLIQDCENGTPIVSYPREEDGDDDDDRKQAPTQP
jgi:hypothetical protein